MKHPLASALVLALLFVGCSSEQSSVDTASASTIATSSTSAADAVESTDGVDVSTPAASTDSTTPATTDKATPSLPLVNIEARSATPDTASRYAVAYYGDSLAASAQEWVGTFLEQGGRLQFLPGTFPGSALCDWYPRFDDDIATYDLWAVVLFFTNNTFSPCMKNDDGSDLSEPEAMARFNDDLSATIDRFTEEGATVYLPTIPTSRGELVLGINPSEQLNAIFAALADNRSDVVLVNASIAVLDEDGNYAETLPCLPTEPCTGGIDENGVGFNVVREPDGVHFCSGGYGPDVPIETDTCPTWSSGAFRYGGALTSPIIAAAQAQWVADHPPSNVPKQVTAAE